MEKQTITIYDVARGKCFDGYCFTCRKWQSKRQTSNKKKSWKLSIAWIIVQMQSHVAWQVRKQQQLGNHS